jgi:serine/threonine-protein kinase RsbW
MAEYPIVKVEIPALSEYVAVIRLAISGVATRMHFNIEEIEDIKIAVSEACTNVVQHAYPDQKDGKIKLIATLHPDHLEIVIEDSGKGFDAKNPVSDKQDGSNGVNFGLGLGLTFIKSLMDSSEIISVPNQGTTVRMTKKAPEKTEEPLPTL